MLRFCHNNQRVMFIDNCFTFVSISFCTSPFGVVIFQTYTFFLHLLNGQYPNITKTENKGREKIPMTKSATAKEV